tara:strand:+ start:209 stop:403 length:195 start_codon:yes stop_codon:yes gene_type:complete
VIGHIHKHVANVLVVDLVEYLTRMTVAPHEARPSKEPEVVAYESLRQVEIFGDLAHCAWGREAE